MATPIARSDHMVRDKLCWDANNAVGLLKQRKPGLDWYEFCCSESENVTGSWKLRAYSPCKHLLFPRGPNLAQNLLHLVGTFFS